MTTKNPSDQAPDLIEQSLTQTLFDKIPPQLADKILFLEHWDEPEGFRLMGAKQRKRLKSQFNSLSGDPTEDNHWVWFGEYRAPTFTPYLARIAVLRTLYAAVRGGLSEKSRLTNSRAFHYSDVNPFKAMPATRALGNPPKGTIRNLDLRKADSRQMFGHSQALTSLQTEEIKDEPAPNPITPEDAPAIPTDMRDAPIPVDPITEAISIAQGDHSGHDGQTDFDSNIDEKEIDPIRLQLCKDAISESSLGLAMLPIVIELWADDYNEPTIRKAFKSLYPIEYEANPH